MNTIDAPRAAAKTGALLFLTGSSGSGKTTLLSRQESAAHGRWSAGHIDDVGVPTSEEMAAIGGGRAWQLVQIRKWIQRASSGSGVLVVEGQARPSDILAEAELAGLGAVKVVLVDCDHDARRERLNARSTHEAQNLDVYAWAAYLAGQADALGLDVIQTTSESTATSQRQLAEIIARFVDEAQPAES